MNAKSALKRVIEHMGPGTIVAIDPAETASRFSACEASLRARGRRYRADAAPELPLGDCSHPDRCVCVYAVQLQP